MSDLKIGGINSDIEKSSKVGVKGDAESFTKALLSNLEDFGKEEMALLDDKISGVAKGPSQIDLTGLTSESPEKFMRSHINFV